MTKSLALLLSFMTLPILSMQNQDLATYLQKESAEDHAHIRTTMCGVEMYLYKHPNATCHGAYLLSCPQAQELLGALLQKPDKSSYYVASLIIRTNGNREAIDKELSLEEAHAEITKFSAPMNNRITQFLEKQKQKHIQEYEKKFGSSDKK